ncbi:hypothetical protein Zmor_028510 [Zophobas morio]|jgi:hypothetical protein|uniref:Uncharacterized protein n=1 Tax=Zophobas morio TaxID=2755281 RepID=A0AA38HKZ3_9CUCU|nr:hypothetical protein Zmor_028510 [Zophobas morio]
MAGYYLHEGKLGAVVVYRQVSFTSSLCCLGAVLNRFKDGQREKRYRVRIGRHLASHVIGLKPRTVEELHSQPFLHDKYSDLQTPTSHVEPSALLNFLNVVDRAGPFMYSIVTLIL